MDRVDQLLAAYGRQLALPWRSGLSGAERVWMAVYPPDLERRLRFRVDDFHHATTAAGHPWIMVDLTSTFPRWLAAHKLLYPDREMPMADEDVDWAVRLALESRRRVKEQQKRIGAMEFRNTHFSYTLGEDGIEQFITTPELQRPHQIGADPLPPGQVWAISPGGEDENPGLFRIDVTVGPGSGVHILNQPTSAAFRESTRIAEQNLLTHGKSLVGDRDPRKHEFNVQLRAFDTARSGAGLGLPALLSLASALLERSLRGGLIVIGGLNLGGGMDPVANAVAVAELAAEKGAETLLAPISARRHLNDLSDDIATRISVLYYGDSREALLKSLGD